MKFVTGNYLNKYIKFLIDNAFTIILFMIILSILLIKLVNINFGIDSIYDEGFLLLRLQSHSSDDLTLSSRIINLLLFKSSNINIILQLKYIKLLAQILTIFFVCYSLFKWLENNKIELGRINLILVSSFIIIFFIPSFDIYTSIFSYNHLQQFIIFLGISSVFLFIGLKKFKFLFLLIGLSILISIVNIPSSGFIYGSLFLLYLFFQRNIEIVKVKLFFIIILGVILTFVLFEALNIHIIHWLINLQKNVNYLVESNRGYDLKKILNSMYEYIYHFIKLSCYYSFYALIYIYLARKKKLFFVLILFFILIFSDLYFLNTLDSIFLFPLIVTLIQERSKIINCSIFYKILIFMTIFTPLLLSIGTNTSLSIKSLYFIPIWGILILVLKEKNINDFNFLKNILILLVTVTIVNQIKWLENSKNINGNFLTSINYTTIPKISKIGIRNEQKRYFEKVKQICERYKISKADYSFSFQLDAMTIYALDTKFEGPFFQPFDYLNIKEKSFFNQPKFIFLNQYEYDRVSDTLSKYYSDFPEKYDKYYIGTTDSSNFGYNTKRWLYCRRS